MLMDLGLQGKLLFGILLCNLLHSFTRCFSFFSSLFGFLAFGCFGRFFYQGMAAPGWGCGAGLLADGA